MGNSINNLFDNSTANVYDKYSGTYKSIDSGTDDKTKMDNNDFLKLIIAQFQNQDFNNATSTSEFMQQMSQFSTLNAVQEITQAVEGMTEQFEAMSYYSNANFATTLVGKNVTIAFENEDGSLGTETGIVQTVSLVEGDCNIIVNGKSYGLSNVMQVNNASAAETPSDEENAETPSDEDSSGG